MDMNCRSCGGKFVRTDLRLVRLSSGKMGTEDIDPLMAHWKCDKCGQIRTQRKRQARKDGTGSNQMVRERSTRTILEEFAKKEQYAIEDLDELINKLFDLYGVKIKEVK